MTEYTTKSDGMGWLTSNDPNHFAYDGPRPGKMRVTPLDAGGNPSGPPVAVTASGRFIVEPYPTREETITRRVAQQRADALDKMARQLGVPPEGLEFADRRLAVWTDWERRTGVAMPDFIREEIDRDAEHARQIRAEKARREEEIIFYDNAWSPRVAPIPPVSPVHEHYVVDECGKGVPASWSYMVDQTTGIETWTNTATGALSVIKDGARVPSSVFWDELGVCDPDLRTVNHPCTLAYDTEHPRQEEGTNSMYTDEAQRIAAQRLQDERNQREADEILTRIREFGEDVYADGTVLRFTKRFYVCFNSKTLAKPETWTALRSTDDSGNTVWSDDQGDSRTWDRLVLWLVTEGKPVSKDELEVWPPTKFPAGTQVSTEITGTVQ